MVLFDKILQTVFFRECEACCFVRPLGWTGLGWAGLDWAGPVTPSSEQQTGPRGWGNSERGGGELGSADTTDTVTAQMSPVI